MEKMLMFFIFICATFIRGLPVSAKCFEMSPKGDVFIRRGEDFHFNCSLKSTESSSCSDDYNITNTRIQKGSTDVSSKLIEYHEAEKTVMTTIRNATFDDGGFYFCLNGDSSAIQAGLTLQVGESPGAPENLTCLSRNFNDMICSFNLSKQEVKIPTVWRMEFRMFSQPWITIPKENCDRNSCLCWLDSRNETSSDLTFMPSARFQVRVEVWNKLGNITTSITIEHTTSIVKPNPVENFGYSFTSGGRHVTLHWSRPKSMSRFMMFLDYKIVITSDWDTRIRLLQNRTAVSEVYALEDLIPFANYSVTVQSRPTLADSDIYWSNTGLVKFVTRSAKSAQTVTMETGSYITLDCGELEMCLVIYWRNPERRYWYGTINGYEVTVKEYQPCTEKIFNIFVEKDPSSTVNTSVSMVTGMAVYGTLETKLLKEKNYQLQTKLINSEGVSRNYSEIFIPNWDTGQALNLEWVVVEITKLSVFISWYMDPHYCSAITSVTYYWCLEDDNSPSKRAYVSCIEGFDWTTFNLTDGCNGRNGHLIRRPLAMPNLKYGVSVKTHSISGGLKWEKFRFQNEHVPESPLYSVSVDGTSLKVHIHYRDYHQSEGGMPGNYTVIWKECMGKAVCDSDVFNGTSRTFSADFLNPVYIIDKLRPGTRYEVQVASLNSFGISKYGEPVIVTIATEFTVQVVEVVTGTLTVVLVLALVFLCCLVRRRYRKLRKNVDITIPNNEISMTERNKEVEESQSMLPNDHDSGKGSESLNSEQFRNSGSLSYRSSSGRSESDENLDITDNFSKLLNTSKKSNVSTTDYVTEYHHDATANGDSDISPDGMKHMHVESPTSDYIEHSKIPGHDEPYDKEHKVGVFRDIEVSDFSDENPNITNNFTKLLNTDATANSDPNISRDNMKHTHVKSPTSDYIEHNMIPGQDAEVKVLRDIDEIQSLRSISDEMLNITDTDTTVQDFNNESDVYRTDYTTDYRLPHGHETICKIHPIRQSTDDAYLPHDNDQEIQPIITTKIIHETNANLEYVKADPDTVVSPDISTVADQLRTLLMNQESIQVETEEEEEEKEEDEDIYQHLGSYSTAPVANGTVFEDNSKNGYVCIPAN